MEAIEAYKGFDAQLRCRGFQYELGGHYEEPQADLCRTGFHGCLAPLDVLRYFPPNRGSRYCRVIMDEVDPTRDVTDSKVAARKITICEEIGVEGLIEAQKRVIDTRRKANRIKFFGTENFEGRLFRLCAHADGPGETAAHNVPCSSAFTFGSLSESRNLATSSAAVSTGLSSISKAGGSRAVSAVTGRGSVAESTEPHSSAIATASCSVATNKGLESVAVTMGERSVALNSGRYGVAMSIGDNSLARAAGESSTAIVEGTFSLADVKGEGSTAIAAGVNCTARGEINCILTIAEWEYSTEYGWTRIGFVTRKVDGVTIKAGVTYAVENGEFVEVRY